MILIWFILYGIIIYCLGLCHQPTAFMFISPKSPILYFYILFCLCINTIEVELYQCLYINIFVLTHSSNFNVYAQAQELCTIKMISEIISWIGHSPDLEFQLQVVGLSNQGSSPLLLFNCNSLKTFQNWEPLTDYRGQQKIAIMSCKFQWSVFNTLTRAEVAPPKENRIEQSDVWLISVVTW